MGPKCVSYLFNFQRQVQCYLPAIWASTPWVKKVAPVSKTFCSIFRGLSILPWIFGRPFMGRRNEYQPQGGGVFQLVSKSRCVWFVCGWQVKLCDPLVTRRPDLSDLDIKRYINLSWTTLNVVMAIILRYFAEFGRFRGQFRTSGWLAVDLLFSSDKCYKVGYGWNATSENRLKIGVFEGMKSI